MVRSLLARIDPPRFALVTGACIAGLVLMGSLWHAGTEVHGFDLRGETNFPSAFSAALLWFAALLALAVAAEVGRRGALLVFAALFAFFGLDEFLVVHERLQDVTGLGRKVVYAPLALAAALVTAAVARQLRSTRGVIPLFLAGAAAWAGSQAIDALQPHNQPHWSVIPEELLEMSGTTLIALALLVALREATPRPIPGESVGRAGVG